MNAEAIWRAIHTAAGKNDLPYWLDQDLWVKVHLPEGRNSTSSGCQSDLYFLANSDLLNVAKIIQTLLKQPDNVSLSQRFVIKIK